MLSMFKNYSGHIKDFNNKITIFPPLLAMELMEEYPNETFNLYNFGGNNDDFYLALKMMFNHLIDHETNTSTKLQKKLSFDAHHKTVGFSGELYKKFLEFSFSIKMENNFNKSSIERKKIIYEKIAGEYICGFVEYNGIKGSNVFSEEFINKVGILVVFYFFSTIGPAIHNK